MLGVDETLYEFLAGERGKFKVGVDDGLAREYTFSLLEKRKEGALDEREE